MKSFLGIFSFSSKKNSSTVRKPIEQNLHKPNETEKKLKLEIVIEIRGRREEEDNNIFEINDNFQ